MRLFPTSLACLLVAAGAYSQTLKAPEVVEPFTIDGNLDEPAWKMALAVELPYEVEPGDNTPAPVRTTCYVLSTPNALVVAFRAEDPNPSGIRAHYADRDRLFRDDHVAVVMDTFADRRKAYEFLVNPLGIQADALRSESGGEDFSFDAIWNAAGKITPEGYQVEMEIPFAALRFPSHHQEQTWGFMALRSYPRSVRRLLASTRIDRNNACTLCQLPQISGMVSARPGRSLELNPTLTIFETQQRDQLEDQALGNRSRRKDLGFSLLWGMSPNLALAATINPDFSQVEADALQLSVNRTFALFYPERRPFFLEGSDFFSTPMGVVHTRTLADPSWGAKFSGKMGSHSVGVLLARDEVTNFLLPGAQESSQTTWDHPSNAGIIRYRYDLGSSSLLGAVFTDRQASGYYNRVGGVDGMVRLSQSKSLQFQVLASQTRYPAFSEGAWADKKVEGHAWRVSGSHHSRNWNAWVFLNNLDEGFRADLGFLPQVGIRGGQVGLEKVFWGKPKSAFTKLELGAETDFWEDQHGQLLNRTTAAMLHYSGPLQSTVFLRVWRFTETWQGTEFSGERARVLANVRFSGDFTSSLLLGHGDAIDYAHSQPARELRISPGFTWNLGRHFYLQGDFTGERLTVDRGELYRAVIGELRAWYHFNTRSFIRLILQHTRMTYDPTLFGESRDPKSLSTGFQVLFSYKLNPKSLLYLGYSSDYQGNSHYSQRPMGHTAFLKLSFNALV